MVGSRLFHFLLAVPVFLTLAATASAQVRVEASVDASTIGVEDVLQLTVSVQGGSGEPRLSTPRGFRLQGRSTSTQVSILNGRMSSTTSYVYTLLPEGEGAFTIGPIEVVVDGESHQTQPIGITVLPGSVRPRRGGPRGPFGGASPFPFRGRGREPELGLEEVFLRAEVPKTTMFEGEHLVVTYTLYCRYVPLGPQIEDDPPLTGFWVEEIENKGDTRPERRVVDGREFLVFPLLERVLFPTTSGSLEIPSMTLSTAFRMTSNNPFDSFFSRGSRPISVRSPAVPIEVQALPMDGRPVDFAGAVGSYALSARLSDDSAAAGDAVTLTLEVTGGGNFRSLQLPSAAETPGFRRFDPKVEESLRVSRRGLEGTKTWEYVLVPDSGGTKELGLWRLSYFDPGEARYVTTTAGPLTLSVSGASNPSSVAGGPTIISPSEVKVLREDIRYLKPAPARLGEHGRPYHGSAWFYLSLALPLLCNGALFALLKRRESEHRDATGRRSRRASRMAGERLKRASKLAADADKEFYEELAAAIYRYVGDKKGISPSGLTSASINQLLEREGVSEAARREFASVLQACEEARFTPGARTRPEMEALRARAEKMLVFLEKQLG